MIKIKRFLSKLWSIQKKYNLFTYVGLLYLTITVHHLRNENKELQLKVVRVETVNQNLISNMIIYNRNFEEFPMPIWQKVKRDGHFILQYINSSYVSKYGSAFNYDRLSVIGKNNFELGYPKELAQQYYESDITVAATGKPYIVTEKITNSQGELIDIKVMKWRVIKDGETLVYGMIIESKEDV